jgi:hypothetical protein
MMANASPTLQADPRFRKIVTAPRTKFVETTIEPPTEMSELSPTEYEDLKRCEEIIRNTSKAFGLFCQAFAEIKAKKLYRENYSRFEDYCRVVCGHSDRNGRYIADAAQVMIEAKAGGYDQEITSPSQTRVLKAIPPERRKEVVEAVKETSKKMTAAKLQSVAETKGILKKTEKAKVEMLSLKDEYRAALEDNKGGWPKPNAHGVYSEVGSDHLDYKTHQVEATIRWLQVAPTQWINSLAYRFRVGSYSAGHRCLKRDHVFGSKGGALEHSLKELQETAQAVATCQSSVTTKPQRTAAHALVKWCKAQREKIENQMPVEDMQPAARKRWETILEDEQNETKQTKALPDWDVNSVRYRLGRIFDTVVFLKAKVPAKNHKARIILDRIESDAQKLHQMFGGREV